MPHGAAHRGETFGMPPKYGLDDFTPPCMRFLAGGTT
jgi:hypothetical protein